MQTQAYEGYFESGKFYTSGKLMNIPERKHILVVIPSDAQSDTQKQIAWNEFKHMVKDTECENALLDGDAFIRKNNGRELINFAEGV